MGKQLKILGSEVEKALAQAVKVAKRERKTITHWIPCYLVANDEPRSINIGPVTIQRTLDLLQSKNSAFETYIKDVGSDRSKNSLHGYNVDLPDIEKKAHELVEAARRYYEHFDWVAQVTIPDFAPRLSAQRARLCIQASLDIFRLFLGRSYGNCIAAEGRAIAAIEGVRIIAMANDDLDISLSKSLTAAEISDNCWYNFTTALAQESSGFLGELLDTLTTGDNPPPLCQRLLDALNWFGQAVVETSPGAAITKFVCSIECITQCGGKDEDGSVTKQFYERAAALSRSDDKPDFVDLSEHFRELYRLRSLLTHGSISPLDPTVREKIFQAEKLTKCVIVRAIEFFDRLGADRIEWTPTKLKPEMEELVQRARRTPSQTVAQSHSNAGSVDHG